MKALQHSSARISSARILAGRSRSILASLAPFAHDRADCPPGSVQQATDLRTLCLIRATVRLTTRPLWNVLWTAHLLSDCGKDRGGESTFRMGDFTQSVRPIARLYPIPNVWSLAFEIRHLKFARLSLGAKISTFLLNSAISHGNDLVHPVPDPIHSGGRRPDFLSQP